MLIGFLMEAITKTGAAYKQVFFILLFMSLLLIAGCGEVAAGASQRTVIRIAYLPITHSAAVMALPEVALHDENFQIELVRFTAWPEVVEALRTGHVDGASLLFEAAVTAYQMGSPLTALSLSHRDGNVIVVDNAIGNLHDLIGKTVAIPHALSPHKTLLHMVLEQEGININDINLVEISPAEMPFLMAAQAISAYVVAEPWGTLAEVRGAGRILIASDEIIPGAVCCLLVFSTGVLDEHEGLLCWLLEKFEQAAAFAESGDEKVFEAFWQNSSFDREVIALSLMNTSFENLALTSDDFDLTTSNVSRFGILDDFPNFRDFAVDRGCCRD